MKHGGGCCSQIDHTLKDNDDGRGGCRLTTIDKGRHQTDEPLFADVAETH